jgi:hypothetical protein
MPKLLFFALVISAIGLSVQCCGPSREEMEYRETNKAIADSVASAIPSITADTINGISYNFIRKADMSCRVNDVLAATRRIEDLVMLHGGYIAKSDLLSAINHKTTVRFKEDSLVESVFYTTTSAMVLRIPSRQLDTLVRSITDMAVFVDTRRLSADDVKMKLFANILAQRRLEQFNNRLHNKLGQVQAPLKQAAALEENLLAKQNLADGRRIESYKLTEQVNYSTVSLALYQPEQEKRTVMPAPLQLKPYEPGFMEKAGTAFMNGFTLLKAFLLFLINSWGFLLIAGLVLWLIKVILKYSRINRAV